MFKTVICWTTDDTRFKEFANSHGKSDSQDQSSWKTFSSQRVLFYFQIVNIYIENLNSVVVHLNCSMHPCAFMLYDYRHIDATHFAP
jgi:hypothetical protein